MQSELCCSCYASLQSPRSALFRHAESYSECYFKIDFDDVIVPFQIHDRPSIDRRGVLLDLSSGRVLKMVRPLLASSS